MLDSANMSFVLIGAAAFAFGYLLGSIPFGLLLTRLAGAGDIRAIGSGNIGATNVLRTGRKGLAAATLLLDGLKGTVAVLLAWRVGGLEPALLAGLGAFIGHLFPVWLKFKGGKGVATYIGILFALSWKCGLAFCAIWLIVAFISRYSSLSGLIAATATPVLAWLLDGNALVAAVLAVMTLFMWFTHRANVARLLNGTEGKIGQKAPTAAPEA